MCSSRFTKTYLKRAGPAEAVALYKHSFVNIRLPDSLSLLNSYRHTTYSKTKRHYTAQDK